MQRTQLERCSSALLTVVALCVSGCTAIGYAVGSDVADKGDKGWGKPLLTEQVWLVAPGSPVQVGLADGGYVRGILLGVTKTDSAGVPDVRPALRLGVGNRLLLDRQFETGKMLLNPRKEEVPDTLTLPLDGIAGLRVSGSNRIAPVAGAAAGFVVDAAAAYFILMLVLAGAGLGFLLK